MKCFVFVSFFGRFIGGKEWVVLCFKELWDLCLNILVFIRLGIRRDCILWFVILNISVIDVIFLGFVERYGDFVCGVVICFD